MAGSSVTVERVTDGDTIVLRDGRRVRLVQIDRPEVYFGTECYGPEASALAERLIPPGTRVRLEREPATDRVDGYGRLLRYVLRWEDGLNKRGCCNRATLPRG
jgi:micrococcal nuclease